SHDNSFKTAGSAFAKGIGGRPRAQACPRPRAAWGVNRGIGELIPSYTLDNISFDGLPLFCSRSAQQRGRGVSALSASTLRGGICRTLCADEPKSDQVNPATAAVLRDLEQVDHPLEAGFPCQIAGDVTQRDLADRFDEHMAIFHGEPPADLHMRALPNADGASNAAFADSLPE